MTGDRYTSAIDLYKQLLGIEAIEAVSPTELHLTYTLAEGAAPAKLALFFDAATKRLAGAQVGRTIRRSVSPRARPQPS